MIEPALLVTGQQIADDLGAWVLHVVRTHPRLSDVLGWARLQAMFARGSDGQTSQAWGRLASWLETLDARQYPQQAAEVIEFASGSPWRGRFSPKPTMPRDGLLALRNAKPLPVCSSCTSAAEAG
jgi:hypothetical protein